jgi:hypothetical protein
MPKGPRRSMAQYQDDMRRARARRNIKEHANINLILHQGQLAMQIHQDQLINSSVGHLPIEEMKKISDTAVCAIIMSEDRETKTSMAETFNHTTFDHDFKDFRCIG